MESKATSNTYYKYAETELTTVFHKVSILQSTQTEPVKGKAGCRDFLKAKGSDDGKIYSLKRGKWK